MKTKMDGTKVNQKLEVGWLLKMNEDKLTNWFKSVEGEHPEGGKDVEGDGVLTYGWGHKNIEGRDFTGFTDKDWDSLLQEDIKDARARAKQQYTNMFGKHNVKLPSGSTYSTQYEVWDMLSEDAQSILTDFTFNVGNFSKSYPKMTEALHKKDWLTVAKEFERPGLGTRNTRLFNKFIYPNLSIDQKMELGIPLEKSLINSMKGM